MIKNGMIYSTNDFPWKNQKVEKYHKIHGSFDKKLSNRIRIHKENSKFNVDLEI